MKISRIIEAPRRALYAACMDPQALAAWLPPAGMRGEMHRFEPWEGGGYRMTLAYDRPSPEARGKTTADSDTVEVRFVELVPDRRIVQAVAFETDDPAYGGTMTMTWRFADAPGGTEVAVAVENAPPGISEADHETGIRSSLENLARFMG
ncbi:MAG: ATPase [Phenylobacterium sp.]|nr:ATPase [Phenylobacterium sp.]